MNFCEKCGRQEYRCTCTDMEDLIDLFDHIPAIKPKAPIEQPKPKSRCMACWFNPCRCKQGLAKK